MTAARYFDPAARPKRTAAAASVAINLALIAVEGAVAFVTGSLAVLADAGHSVFDLAASLFAYWGVSMAARPPDPGHHYGHAKFENFSSLVQVALVGLIAIFIAVEVAVRLATGYRLEVPTVAIAVVAATVVVDYAAARYLGNVARTYGSYALEADAFHFSTDLWAKGAALVGLLGGRVGAEWLDPAAALAVAGVMVYTAARLGLRTSSVLLDAAPSSEVEGEVRRILDEEVRGGYHSLRMRQAGKWVHLDVALDLPGHITLAEAHDLACRISRRLCREVPEVRDAVVYVEPYSHHAEREGDQISGPPPDAR
ncbi:MAG: cation diffusion facilitator family transporter [Dehalococcoidia bacterium]|jgi:cation diffusion facilitator family transporter|nr:cation diffusion facilitator family transporter [Dehalococcoidia bacterium]MDW8008191.1 cation diffusion facilitator family transporter [Chloroflexota bacterium]